MSKVSKLDDSMKAAIDSYSQDIKTLKDFVSAVRKRPGMYIGPIGNRGFLNMFREAFQNSVDQLIKSTSPCDLIAVHYDERTKEITIEDNGLGLPFNSMIRIMTKQHTSVNFEKKLFEYSSGLNGIGIKVCNALSVKFIAESYRYDGEARRLTLSDGYPDTEEPVSIPNPNLKQGTKVTFFPSEECLGEITLEWGPIYRLIKRIISLTPLGSTVHFTAVDMAGKVHDETIVNKDGIITDLIMKMSKPFIKPIIISTDTGEKKVDVAFCYDSEGTIEGEGPNEDMNITAFSNMCPTTDGTHIEGFILGVNAWFTDYTNRIYLSNSNKVKVTSADIKCGLNVMLSVAHLDPQFTGQAKEILSNEDMKPFVKTTIMQGLDQWSKENPQDLQKLCKYFKELAEIRQKRDASKQKIVNKFQQSSITGMPGKFCKPEGKEHLELLICEGDSAGGQAKDARCKKRQGVFPIRGKMPNAFKTKYEDFMGNAEVQSIIKILFNAPYKKSFDPVKDCKWEKIIFMADADIDGHHINSLLLRFFILYMPQLIEAGKVYKSVPPLYSIGSGKKTIYFTDRIDIVRYIQKIFSQTNTIEGKNGVITGKDLTVLLGRNDDYVYEMDRIANRYSVDPYLLELSLVSHINKNSSAILRKQIKSEYRFMDVEDHEKYDTKVIRGILNSKFNTLYLNDKLIADCERIITLIKENDEVYYTMNGEKASLYKIMKTFDETSPNSIQRYKGLGEMPYEALSESTIHPDGNRTLIRYTIDDIKEEIQAIRTYETNTKLFLAEVDKVSRTDLLGI